MVNYKLGLWENYKITKPIRLIELFAGYGSQALALKNLGVEFDHHQVVEFDKYAIKTYNALHDTNFDTQDITQLQSLNVSKTNKYEYIMTYSFPCTDLSLAGKGLGMKVGTRSGLLWEVERLLKNAKELPQVLLMENVTQVHGVKHKEDFDKWISFLTNLGYSNIWKDLNAKDYGIPQSRNRTFMVSILGEYDYQFPKKQTLKLKLKDMLEQEVDEKYYLSDKMLAYLNSDKDRNGLVRSEIFRPHFDTNHYAHAITTNPGNRASDNFIVSGQLRPKDRDYNKNGGKRQEQFEPRKDEISNAILTNDIKNMVLEVKSNKQELANRLAKSEKIKPNTAINHSYTNKSQKENSRINDDDYIESKDGVISTLHTRGDTFGVKTNDLRIRKLTPRECLRLMGLNDYQIDKAYLSGNSNAQLYKQAGNSIVVQVLEKLFKGLL